MKKVRGLVLVLSTVVSSFAVQAQEFVTVLTGGTSGVYYPMGVALSQIYGKAMPGAKTSAQVTKASAENLNLLQAGRGEIAFTLGDALNGRARKHAVCGVGRNRRRTVFHERFSSIAHGACRIDNIVDQYAVAA